MARIARRRHGREPARDPRTSAGANTIERETRFCITSLVWIAAQIGPAIRAHWMIENGLHLVLDMNFRDDARPTSPLSSTCPQPDPKSPEQGFYPPPPQSRRLERRLPGKSNCCMNFSPDSTGRS